jgi:hypothetical protein
MMRTIEDSLKTLFRFSIALLLLLSVSYSAEQKAFREEGRFNIYVAGKEIGQEKFSIQSSGDSIASRSSLSFRDPANNRQNVKMDTDLTMDSRFIPRSYQVRTDANGQKGMLKGTFAKGQAEFEYLAGGSPKKTGLLVGDRYLILDTNVFHHFIFIARSFDLNSKEKSQSMEVVIPQEFENGLLQVSNLGSEKLSVSGKNREVHHLRADTGLVQIDLWVDDNRVLCKIALPAKRIEVVRN